MGYNFTIGNAVPSFDKSEFPDLRARWVVEHASHPDAPVFPNDYASGNYRSPCYSVWKEFCQVTGIYDLFYEEETGRLHAGHPGCVGITEDDANAVTAALLCYQANATKPPGFERDDSSPERASMYDHNLARLIWLEWWMHWAIRNCETPAIQNT